MTDQSIKPALIPDQWRAISVLGKEEIAGKIGFACDEMALWGIPPHEDVGRHGLAAIALDGQPFGFTRVDVLNLKAVEEVVKRAIDLKVNVYPTDIALLAWLAYLRERIEALLPPEEM